MMIMSKHNQHHLVSFSHPAVITQVQQSNNKLTLTGSRAQKKQTLITIMVTLKM